MADITVTNQGAANKAKFTNNVVWATASIGYVFFLDSGTDVVYVKTTDGGQTWGVKTTFFAGNVVIASFWFEKWTPGDTGTKIHVVHIDSGTDDVVHQWFDTADDSISAQHVVFAGSTMLSNLANSLSIAKMRGGNLIVVFDGDAAAETGTYRSVDGGVNWTIRTNAYEAASDWAWVLPGNELDNNDAYIIYFDSSTSEVTLKVHDDSANTNSESAVIAAVVQYVNDPDGRYPLHAAIRHSDGHTILVLITERDPAGATADFRVFDINGSASIVEKTALATNIDDCYYPSVFVDNLTDDIYVAYIGKRDGSEQLEVANSTGVYYSKSTDDGATWSAGDTAYSAALASMRGTMVAPGGPRFGVVWITGTTSFMGYNYDNSVAFSESTTTTTTTPDPHLLHGARDLTIGLTLGV